MACPELLQPSCGREQRHPHYSGIAEPWRLEPDFFSKKSTSLGSQTVELGSLGHAAELIQRDSGEEAIKQAGEGLRREAPPVGSNVPPWHAFSKGAILSPKGVKTSSWGHSRGNKS